MMYNSSAIFELNFRNSPAYNGGFLPLGFVCGCLADNMADFWEDIEYFCNLKCIMCCQMAI